MRTSYLDSSAATEILFEFSKAIRHSLIAIGSLNDLGSISFDCYADRLLTCRHPSSSARHSPGYIGNCHVDLIQSHKTGSQSTLF